MKKVQKGNPFGDELIRYCGQVDYNSTKIETLTNDVRNKVQIKEFDARNKSFSLQASNFEGNDMKNRHCYNSNSEDLGTKLITVNRVMKRFQ